MSKTAWIIFAAVCVIGLGTLVFLTGSNKVDVSNVDTNSIQTGSEASGSISDHVFGKADSKVVLIEYGDFQCPGCGSAHPMVKALSEKYEDQIAFVFRNFPLTTIHPNALAAAAAAEAAGLQGKYWEMHNTLFENQSAWSGVSTSDRTDTFASYAQQIGVDIEQFRTDFAGEAVSKKINYDLALGRSAGASSTPTFYLNGEQLGQDTWGNEESFEKAIIAELEKNDIALPEATEAVKTTE